MITFDEKKYPQITDAEIKDALQFSTEQVIRDLPEQEDFLWFLGMKPRRLPVLQQERHLLQAPLQFLLPDM